MSIMSWACPKGYPPEIMETAATTRGRPGNTKSHGAILDAAFVLLQWAGHAAATVKRIGPEAGMAKQTIYRWWKGKAPLSMEVLALKAGQAVDLPDTGHFQSDLTILLTGTFAAVSTTLKPLMRALAVELLEDDAFANSMRDVFVARRRSNLRTLVQRAVHRRELPNNVDAELICDLVFGPMWYRLMFDHAELDQDAAGQLAFAVTQAAGRAKGEGA